MPEPTRSDRRATLRHLLTNTLIHAAASQHLTGSEVTDFADRLAVAAFPFEEGDEAPPASPIPARTDDEPATLAASDLARLSGVDLVTLLRNPESVPPVGVLQEVTALLSQSTRIALNPSSHLLESLTDRQRAALGAAFILSGFAYASTAASRVALAGVLEDRVQRCIADPSGSLHLEVIPPMARTSPAADGATE